MSVLLIALLALSPLALAQPDGRGPPEARDAPPSDARPEAKQTRGGFDGAYDGRWVDVHVDAANGTLRDLRIDGIAVLSLVDMGQPLDVHVRGNHLIATGADAHVKVQDARTGVMQLRSDENLPFELTWGGSANLSQEGDHHILTGEGFRAMLAGDLRVTGTNQAEATELRFHLLAPGRGQAGPSSQASERAHQVHDAIVERRVAGEISLRGEPEVRPYDDVNITVASANGTYKVVFDAELESGRTFVLDVDPSLLAGPELELRYFDVNDDGTETEVVFRMADSLDDILDAGDDRGQPEYWIVEDADGLQVMVTVPHWSVHAITIQGIGAFVTQPSVLLGIGAGIAGVAVAALVMLRPRRD